MLDESKDPEAQLEELRDTALEATTDLIPILMEKAVNGRTRDTLAIFEALADRGGFFRQEPVQAQNTQPMINLNFNTQDMTQMLNGLKTITQSPSSSGDAPPNLLPSSQCSTSEDSE